MEPRQVVVTGANRADGIGLAIVRELASSDAELVVGTYRDAGRAEALLALTREDSRVRAAELDVASDASVAAFGAWAAREVGQLDLLVNNAGLGSGGEDVLTSSLDELQAQLESHAIGMLRVTRALRPLLHRGSVVINVSSTLGSIASMRGGGWAFYGAAKALQNALTRQLAAALRSDGVIVCAVSPGWVATSMSGGRAPLTPQQSARDLVRFARDATSAASGEFFEHDGSRLAW